MNWMIKTPISEWSGALVVSMAIFLLAIVFLLWAVWVIDLAPRLRKRKLEKKHAKQPQARKNSERYLRCVREMMQKEIDEAIDKYEENFTTILHVDDRGEAAAVVREIVWEIRQLPLEERISRLAQMKKITGYRIDAAINKRKGLA